MLAKGNSTVWSVRAACCHELSALLQSERRGELSGATAERVTAFLQERLSDPHYKVVHAALGCIGAIAAAFPYAVEPTLERLLPCLLLRAQEQRDTLRAAAHSALQALQAVFPPEALLPVLLRVMDVPTPRVRAAALTMLASCVGSAPAYVATPSHMRACVAKVHAHLSDKSPELRRGALTALHALHDAGGAAFLGQVTMLPLPAQSLIKSLMAPRLASLESDLAQHAKQRRAAAAASPAPPTAPPPPPGGYAAAYACSPRGDAGGAPSFDGYATNYGSGYANGGSHAPPTPTPPPLPGADLRTESSAVGGARAPASAPPPPTPPAAPPSAAAHVGLAGGYAGAAPDPALRPLQPVGQLAANQQAGPASGGGYHHLTAGGSEDWLALMPSLLRQLAGNASIASQRDALLKMQKMCLCAPADAPVWGSHFEHSLEAVLRAVTHSDERMRELGMACIKDLLRSQPQRFKAFTEHVLLRLLGAGRDASREISAAAEEGLELLLSLSDPHRCMAVLVPVVMKEGPPTLQLAVRLQSKLVPRFSQLQLLAILPQVRPAL